MRKGLLTFILVCFILIFIKYYFSNFNISYTINDYKVKSVYKDSRLYYEIDDGKYKYNFDVYSKRSMNKNKINKIVTILDDDLKCIYPVIKNINTYPLCYYKDEFIDYHLIESNILDQYKFENIEIDKSNNKDFIYYNNLNKNEYVALWNYRGYIVMNDKSYKNVDLFEKDKYDNTLAYLLNDTIYMPNNDEEYEFSKLIALNIKNLSKKEIDLGYTIDYDSYIVGSIKNKLYIFDNKRALLYEINTKNNKTKIIGSNEKGFVKFENNKETICSKSEYTVNKVIINNTKSLYNYKVKNGVYKSINDNKKISQKILSNNVNIISEYKNKIYYQFEDSLFMYDPLNGSSKIFYNYELNFNSNNTIFVYNK